MEREGFVTEKIQAVAYPVVVFKHYSGATGKIEIFEVPLNL